MNLSEEDHRKCAQSVLSELQEWRKQRVAKWTEIAIRGLQPRSRTILADILPVDLYIWIAEVSPQARRMLDDTLAEPEKA